MTKTQQIQDLMKRAMNQGIDFGQIPGTNSKPTLLKPGAEKLSLVFRLRPVYDVRRSDLPGGHREYEVVCTLYHIPTGQSVGQGVGSATTMEGKYRYRGGEKEGTGQPVPKEYWNLKNAGKAEDAKARSAVALKTKMFTSSRAKSAEISAASAQASANYNISFTSNNDESKKAEEKLQRIFLPKLKMCISEHTLKYGHYSVSMTLDWQVLNSKVVNFKVKRLSVPKEDIADLLTCFETQIVEFAAAAAVPSQTDTAFSFDVSFEK